MLIQSVLFFILGVAATTFVLILLSPAIWRRALYLARQAIAAEVPLSLTEVEADRDFLRAKQAVELVTRDEKFERLSEKFATQKRELDQAKEELFRLGDAEHRAGLLAEQLADQTEELETERQLTATLEANKGKELAEIRDLLQQERQASRAEADRTEQLKALEKEVATLKEEVAAAKKEALANKTTKTDMENLRQEILNTAAKFTAEVAISEGDTSPIPELVEKVHDRKSLAGRIKKELNNHKKQSGQSTAKVAKPASRKKTSTRKKTTKSAQN